MTLAQGDTSRRPNVVMIMVDDAGLMDFAPFGGEAHMPNIQKLADEGTRFTGYRTSPLCAPSRAMFLTGIDNHRTGIASIPEVLPKEHEGKPGYSMVLEPGVKTIADRLRDSGYRTYMTGKWHLGEKVSDLPVSHGFDRSFALAASGADNWEQRPYMPYYETAPWFEDDQPATLPEDFYSSKFIVDKMMEYIGDEDHEGNKPFLAYLAFQAIHVPIQAPREFTEHYEGVYDQGWHALREARWQKAQSLGLIPEGVPLAEMPEQLREWDQLTDQERRYYSKAMAVNAGMLEAMDHHVGRFMAWLASRGELDNTIFVVTSDNGPEFNDVIHSPGVDLWFATSGYRHDIETMGEKGSLVSIGPEWALAGASPSNLFKFHSTDGGIRVPLIIAGPKMPKGQIQKSLSMVTDIVPTVLDYLQIPSDAGIETGSVSITGRSLKPVINGEAEHIYGPDDAVAIEVAGNAALFKGQYKLTRNLPAYGDGQWRLYDLGKDPGETQDISEANPAVFEELMADYKVYTEDFGVLEMPEGYNAVDQIMSNIVRKMLASNWFLISIGIGLLFLAVVFTYRRIRA
ncbi:arylsulfatase AtsA [Maricurvus nonylphenolicus]|uniref:arylsulfatase n=1 Tax=Maricurvus nonylphenolicus TaxID=1008307 RepID=UPI0036F26706